MQQILGAFQGLGWREVLFAACVAYVITYIIRIFGRFRRREETYVVRSMDVAQVYEKCRELFPIDRVTFHGREFTRGMRVKVTTVRRNVIEGELIGMNRLNLVCIRTRTDIIAHQLEKIAEITVVE